MDLKDYRVQLPNTVRQHFPHPSFFMVRNTIKCRGQIYFFLWKSFCCNTIYKQGQQQYQQQKRWYTRFTGPNCIYQTNIEKVISFKSLHFLSQRLLITWMCASSKKFDDVTVNGANQFQFREPYLKSINLLHHVSMLLIRNG